MGVWDMMYLMQQYKKALEQADNLAFSDKTRAEFAEKAEVIRQQMNRYLERVENRERLQKIENRDDLLTQRSSPQSP
jgi:hypothetical protein